MTNETQFLTPFLKRGKTGGGPSKMLIDRIRAAEGFDASIKAFKAAVAEGFGDRLSPQLLDGETLPDHAFTLDLFRRSVSSARDELVAADDRYVSMETRKSLLSMECDRVARQEVYPSAQRIRHRIEALLGKHTACNFHGIRGRMRRKPCRLLDQLGPMVHFLSRPLDERFASMTARPRGGRAILASKVVRPPGGRGRSASKMIRPPGGQAGAASKMIRPPRGRGRSASKLTRPPLANVSCNVEVAAFSVPDVPDNVEVAAVSVPDDP